MSDPDIIEDMPETIEGLWKIFCARTLGEFSVDEAKFMHAVFFCGAQAVMSLMMDGVRPSALFEELDVHGRDVAERARQACKVL